MQLSMSSSPPLLKAEPSRNYGSVAAVDVRVSPKEVKTSDIAHVHLHRCMSFHDVTYMVNVGRCIGRRRSKTILNSVSGMLPPGLNAIMGPTGSGKTTLLDILADRKDKSGLSGDVLVNGEYQPNNFRIMSGYVVQEDVVMGTLSVRENLQFSAALRLPSHMTRSQRKERVEKVIAELGLQACVDTKVGTEFIRGVSGGEKKRTNIGMELIIEPQVLFLDEPTTGLDAHTAVSVVQLLKQLSTSSERIVIMSIHQPRYSIFKLFDTLTLLSRGDLVYHGPSRMALGYFDRIGFRCEEHDNPADYFLDVITHCESQSVTVIENTGVSESPSPVGAAVDLPEAYLQSEECRSVQTEIRPILENLQEKEAQPGAVRWIYSRDVYATNFIWQFLVVFWRSVLNLVRNPMTSFFQLIVVIIFALVVGIIYFRINDRHLTPRNVQNAFSDRLGAIFFIVLNQVFGNLSAIDLFISQKAIFIHENATGFYRVSAFFVAKVFSDIIPMRLIPLCFFAAIAYFMIGFQLELTKFFIFLLGLALTSVAASSIGFAVSARMKVTAMANLFVALIYVLSMLFGGLFLALNSLPEWVRWLKWVSIFRYGVEALAINELSGFYCYTMTGNNATKCSDSLPVELVNTTCDCAETSPCCSGTLWLERLGYETTTDWLWNDIIALAGLILFFLFVGYIGLRTVKKEK